ncbi:DUF4097 family beta strand repeat-containing protein [Shewanella xiamenensis]|uniref:DUF4097 family beta strand repeat-containing protein n=1 Tax=Shewanella xiamenensis TaxID=332186 RepID=UPI002E7C4615|nr:DUF4097 family beta strand repeat-containing protein [Shewanella xiamenensis]MEE1981638.1 DUF4097 family beta strand repeat-containing protein [Shewanella xiamenensis]
MSHFTLTKTSLFVSTLYLGLMGSVFAAESVDKQLPMNSDTLLQIKVQRGEVQIQSWDKNEVSVTGTLDELSEGFVFEQKGNNLTIEDKMPRHYNGSDNNGSKLTIKVPKSVKLSADTISANLQISQTQGELELNTVSGNITAEALDGTPTLHTVSGDIATKGLAGKVMLDTVSGEIKDTQSKGEIKYRLVSGDLNSQTLADKVKVEQVSGEIKADFNSAKEVNVRTVSGDTQVSLAKSFDKANLESVSGDIIVTFADTPDANFELNGGPGGKIKNGLSQDAPQRQKYVPNESLSFQTGSGSASVKMDTISGNLILKKQ